MSSLYVGGQWCPQCGAEYRPGFVECSDCHVPLSRVKPPVTGPPVDDDGDHEQIVYDLGAWEEDHRRALKSLATISACVPAPLQQCNAPRGPLSA